MEWPVSSPLIPYLLPSDYHTSAQSSFILHFSCISNSLRSQLSFSPTPSPSLSLLMLVCLLMACTAMAFQRQKDWTLSPSGVTLSAMSVALKDAKTHAVQHCNQILTERQEQHDVCYLMIVILQNHVTCCITPHLNHAKPAEEHGLPHLIMYHYFLLACGLQLSCVLSFTWTQILFTSSDDLHFLVHTCLIISGTNKKQMRQLFFF